MNRRGYGWMEVNQGAHIYIHTACAMVEGEGRGAEDGHEGGHVTRTVGTWLSVFIVSSSLVSDHDCGESAGEKSPRREEEGACPHRHLSAHTLQSAHTPAGHTPTGPTGRHFGGKLFRILRPADTPTGRYSGPGRLIL
jgi:hypothetical protein